MRPFEGKERITIDFLWMTERHDLCRPSALISKDANCKRIDKKMMDKESGINLLDAEVESQNDIIKEREEALARELAALKKRTKKLVDPIQYAFSISDIDLADYEPTFAWEMGPVSERQAQYLERVGIDSSVVTCSGMGSMLIDKLINRQNEGLTTPKQIRTLENMALLM